MTDWTPETNRIPFGLLTEDEKAALQACEHGWETNARFLAAARELVPALLAERDALKAEVDRLKAQADAVWNEAIEAAEMEIQNWHSCDGNCVSTLKRQPKGESHE